MGDQRHASSQMIQEKQFLISYHYYYVDAFLVVFDSLATELNNIQMLLRYIAYVCPRDSYANSNHGRLVNLAGIHSNYVSWYSYTYLLMT